jgi:hypothetical protein
MDAYRTQIDRGSDRFQRNRAEMLARPAEIDMGGIFRDAGLSEDECRALL